MKKKAFIFAQISIISLTGCMTGPIIKYDSISSTADINTTSLINENLDWITAELTKKQYPYIVNKWPNMMLSIGYFQNSFKVVENYLNNIGIKHDVKLRGLKDEMSPVLLKASSIWSKYGKKLTVTSALDGKHCKNSLHYSGLALDLRSRDFKKSIHKRVLYELKKSLGEDYFVLLEKDHFHVEFDHASNVNHNNYAKLLVQPM